MTEVPALWEHQKRAISLGLSNDSFAFFLAMRTGKSRVIIEILRHRSQKEGKLLKTLILCPQVVCQNWVSEISKYSKIQSCFVRNLGPLNGKQRVEKITTAENDIIVINYQGLISKSVTEALYAWGPDMLVLDESHRCKSPKAVTSKRVEGLADQVKYKYLLSGTPITNDISDIWQQFRILDNGKTFGRSYWPFRAKWLQDNNAKWAGKPNYFPNWQPRFEMFPQFTKLLASKAMVVKTEDCMDLPPVLRGTITVELAKTQRKYYEEMKREFITYVQDLTKEGKPKAAIAQLALTKTLRMQQIVSGFMKLDDDSSFIITDNPRLKVLQEYLTDLCPTNKVVVWACFKQNYLCIADVCRRMGLKYVELHGEVPKKDRDENIRRFQQDPEVSVLIGNQGAGGIGIDLTAASTAIYYSKNYSLEQDAQSHARIEGIGSLKHKRLTRLDLVATDTIDELINEALEKKQNLADVILDF